MRYLLSSFAAAASLAGALAVPALAQPPGRGGPPPQGGIPGGSYEASCRNAQMVQGGGWMTAECRANNGRWAFSRLPYKDCRADIQNRDGILGCGAITADSGRFVDEGGDRRDENRDDRAAAAVAGAVVGALLGPPPPPPPGLAPAPSGRDWRYERGGWGYGHRPGEWVSMRDRASWVDDRIDRAQREGRIGRRDARDLHRELDNIVDQEGRYLRDGRLDQRERDDLQRRFDDLERRIDYQRR